MEYTPYGESWIDEGSNKHIISHRFTSQELDEETGLYYFGARYLDPKTSRWMSVDPALGRYVPQPGGDPSKLPGMGGVFNPVNLNLYHYAGNNPIKYVDPDGKFVAGPAYLLAKAIIEGVTALFCLFSLTKIQSNPQQGLSEGHGASIPKGWNVYKDFNGNWIYADKSGNAYDSSINPWDVENIKGSFNKSNFRKNLKRYTGESGYGKHAHHVFPQEFINDFEALGIDIHDPRGGAWWEGSDHLNKAKEYNQQWETFFQENPTAKPEDVLNYGRELADEYGFDINY
ncbi:MAG: hypothetical protein KAU17_13560, partial [Spirochaetales bacterium]|nr:hypothetical protein [Spirochaetales bacterium]